MISTKPFYSRSRTIRSHCFFPDAVNPFWTSPRASLNLLVSRAALSLIRQGLVVILTFVLWGREGTFIIFHLMNCRREARLILLKSPGRVSL